MRGMAGRALTLSMALAVVKSSEVLAQQRAAPAGPPPIVTILQTRSWSPDGKVPTGTIWRGFQTWRTDVARTEKGELVSVDPMTPRVGRSGKGELIRYHCNQPGWALPQKLVSVEILPARQVHGSAWPMANWQAPDFDDSTWIRDPYPQRELYGLVALRCLRGKFEVPDPARARELSLTLRFRGGAVAYINGREIGRAFLPKGEIRPETLAEDYPQDAYVAPEGVLIEQGIFLRGTNDKEADKEHSAALRGEIGCVIWGGNWNWHAAAADSAYPGNFVS